LLRFLVTVCIRSLSLVGQPLIKIQTMKTQPLFRVGLSLALLAGALGTFAQSLTVTNDLQLWLKADAGVTTNASGGVTQWTDQTTNGNNALQGAGTAAPLFVANALNTRPVLRFDGVDDFLDVADSDSLSGTGDMASFFVVKFADFVNYNAVWAKTAGNLPAPTDVYTPAGDSVLRVFRGDGTFANLSAVDSVALRGNAYLVLGFDVAGSTLTHYLNNQTNGSGTVTINTADGNTPLKIGTRSDAATRMKGDIAEILIFSRALSSLERSNVFSYLQTKYNLLNLTPNISLSANPPGPAANSGDIVTLNATASDPDGTIAKVDFFAHGALIGTATLPPYSLRVVLESSGSVQFTARATDDKGAVANSAAITFNVAATAPPPLSVTNGLQLWLKGDAGTTVGLGGGVTQWADQSGRGNNAAQPNETLAPVLTNGAVNGWPALRFDGTDDVLEVPDSDSISIPGDITSFFVARFTDFAVFRAIWSKTLGNFGAPIDFYVVQGNGRLRLFRSNGATGGASTDSTLPFAANAFMLGGFDISGSSVRHFYNGTLNGTGAVGVGVDGNGPIRIGRRADGAVRMKGEIAEIIIFNRVLSASELTAVRRYLIEKYALPTALVGVTNTPPVVAITSPSAQPILPAPANVAVNVDATDADGSVASVDFYANGIYVGTDTIAPFGTNLTVNYGGPFRISATATDNLGARALGTSVQICLQGPGGPSGLIGYWPLDGDASAVIGRSGIMVSNPVPAMDRNSVAGGALFFDGTLQQRVEVPGGGGLNGLLRGTISLWVKWSGVQDVGFSAAAGAVLGRQQDGIFSDNIITLTNANPDNALLQWRQNSAGGISATSTIPVLTDTWRHIAVTFTETNSELYLDGFLESTGTGGLMHSNVNIALSIGAWIGAGGSFSTATIDDVAIWNRVLSVDEVQAIAGQVNTPMDLLTAPDCLTVERDGGTVTVRWNSNGVLQSASEVNGTYEDVAGATNPYMTTAADPRRFFRLRSP
jgi:hypothetical protein